MTFVIIRSKGAFSFIELILVIAIISILASVSFPNLKKTADNLRYNAFTGQFQAFTNYLRQRAIMERKDTALRVKDNLYYGQALGASDKIKPSFIPEGISINMENGEPLAPTAELVFHPDGSLGNSRVTISSQNKRKSVLSNEGIFSGLKITDEK